MPWDPAQYHKFQAERARPFEDCLALVARRPGLRVIDLGCGTGELTRRLADALPGSDVLGVDSSAEMLARAAAWARPGLRFARGTIEELVREGGSREGGAREGGAREGGAYEGGAREGGAYDLVFSHAALHWVDDHEALLPRLFARVAPGGQLVAQLPSNHGHLSHRAIVELAAEAPFAAALPGGLRPSPVLPVERYAELLWAAGGRELTALEKVYPHELPDAAAIAEWTRGTTLVPLLERLPAALHEPFLARYRARLEEAYPGSPLFYGFKRIVFAARRTIEAKEERMAKFKGKVVHSDLEGGFWTLEADDGETYKLEGGDAGLKKANAKVEVEGAVDEEAMGIGFGAPVLKVSKYKIL